jgi:hypothetical protein
MDAELFLITPFVAKTPETSRGCNLYTNILYERVRPQEVCHSEGSHGGHVLQ